MKIKNLKISPIVCTYKELNPGDMFVIARSKSNTAPYIKQSFRMATNLFLGAQEKRSLTDNVQRVLSFNYVSN